MQIFVAFVAQQFHIEGLIQHSRVASSVVNGTPEEQPSSSSPARGAAGEGADQGALTMRYVGLSLGMGMALGYCAAMGTLLPPVFKLFLAAVPGLDIVQIATTLPGAVTLLGCLITLAGIGVTAKARAPPAPRPPKAPGQSSPARLRIIPTSSPS